MSEKSTPSVRFDGLTNAWEQRKGSRAVHTLRFKADDGSDFPEWEERQLSELASIHARIGWQNLRRDEFLSEGDYLLITGTDFSNGRVNYSTCHYVDKNRYEQDPHIQVQNGTILVTKDGTLGKVAMVDNLTMPATLNAGVFAIKVSEPEVSPNFLYHWLAAPMLLQYAAMKSTGGTIKHLNQEILVEFPVQLPSFPEQQKIAAFLSTVDSTIDLCQRKVDLLTQAKKALMQQIFSQKLRFKADDGSDFPDWEKKKLGEILAVHHGRDYKHLEPGDIPVMGTGGVITYVNQALCDWPCVCIGRKGTINKPIYMDTPFWSVDTLFFTKPKKNNSALWQYDLFQMINWDRYNEATGVPSLSSSTIESIRVAVPSLPEQQKIAACLSSADALIDQARSELEQWQEVKKSLLQQMFV